MHDYHNAEVIVMQNRVSEEGSSIAFRAVCLCGWSGPRRIHARDADEDKLAHDVADNPGRFS